MQPYNELISEALGSYTPKRQYERILELLEAEKKLAIARGVLQLMDSFRESIEQTHPVLARYVPINQLDEIETNQAK